MCPRGRYRHGTESGAPGVSARARLSDLPYGQAAPSAPRALVMVVVASAVLSVEAFCTAAIQALITLLPWAEVSLAWSAWSWVT